MHDEANIIIYYCNNIYTIFIIITSIQKAFGIFKNNNNMIIT